MPKHKDLTQGAVSRQLLGLSIPMFFGLFAIFFFGVTDAYFLGKLGIDPLSAMGFVFPIIAVFMSISRGMGEGAISMVSRMLGSSNVEDAKLISTAILVISVLFVGFCVILGWIFMKPVLVFLGAQDEVLALAISYLRIWFGGLIFLVIPMVGNSLIRAAGDTRFPAMLMVFAALGNMILDPIFIFGWGFIPSLGMEGAAVASIVSRVFTLIASLYLVHYKYRLICFDRWRWKRVVEIGKEFMVISAPAALNFLIIPLTMAFVTKMMASFSQEHVAAFGVALQVEKLSILPFYALGIGMSSFVGQNFGALKHARLKEAVGFTAKACMLIGLLLFGVFYFFAESIIAIFQQNPTVIKVAGMYLTVVSVSYALEGVYLFCVNSLNVVGKAFHATMLVVLRMACLYLPIAYLCIGTFGYQAIFYAAVIANIGGGLLGLWMVNRKILEAKSNK